LKILTFVYEKRIATAVQQIMSVKDVTISSTVANPDTQRSDLRVTVTGSEKLVAVSYR